MMFDSKKDMEEFMMMSLDENKTVMIKTFSESPVEMRIKNVSHDEVMGIVDGSAVSFKYDDIAEVK